MKTSLLFLWLALLSGVQLAAAQGGAPLTGRLVNSLSGDPVASAVVVVEGQGKQATSAADGSFTIEGLAPGTYHLIVKAQGYSDKRTEVTVAAAAPATPLTVPVDPEIHFEEVLSVSPEARSQLDAFQPTSVLAGQELTKQLDISLGETLRNQPGVAVRSLGGAPARPVVRGLDGDRVLILQDGQRTGDLSSQSSDHGVSVNPAAAQRIEVVRGPATLLYGANAIGGLVNVITDEIPSAPQRGAKGTVTFDAASAGTQAGTAADVHVGNGTLALHAGGGGRRSSNMDTPEGEVANSQSRSALRQRRPGLDRREGLLRRQLRLRRHEIRRPRDRGRHPAADAAPPCADVPRRGRSAGRAVRVVSRVAGAPPLPPRRAGRLGGRHRVSQRHHRVAADGGPPRGWQAEG